MYLLHLVQKYSVYFFSVFFCVFDISESCACFINLSISSAITDNGCVCKYTCITQVEID